jgi:hypothetical protein
MNWKKVSWVEESKPKVKESKLWRKEREPVGIKVGHEWKKTTRSWIMGVRGEKSEPGAVSGWKKTSP